jgi:hypothetical protein
MTSTFAKGTNVSVERSRAALDALLRKHGASSRVIGEDNEHCRAMVGFVLKGAKYRLNIPLPPTRVVETWWIRATKPFLPIPGRACPLDCPNPIAYASGGSYRCEQHVPRKAVPEKQRAQRERERWRLVILLVKAKLEAIRLGLSTPEREFMADMVTDDGRTLEEVLNAGDSPRLLGPKTTPKETRP